jgi:hypothetical protein
VQPGKALLIALLGLCCCAWTIELSWNPNRETDLAGYKVYVSRAQNAGYQLYSSIYGNYTAAVIKITGGPTVYLSVTAFNTSGVESIPSNLVIIDRYHRNQPRPETINGSMN